ncbi:MAG: LuxR C-terminal-related transcriptional regulator [Armatimonadota bacterium]
MSDSRLLLIYEDGPAREGIALVLSSIAGMRVVASVGHRYAGIAEVLRHQPDIVIVALPPDEALQTLESIRLLHSMSKVLVMHIPDDFTDMSAFIRSGASGFVPMSACTADLVQAVEALSRGEVCCPPQALPRLFHDLREQTGNSYLDLDALSLLSAREREIAELVAAGKSNSEIAESLFISIGTVKNHIHKILGKLGCSRREDVVQYMRFGATYGQIPVPWR